MTHLRRRPRAVAVARREQSHLPHELIAFGAVIALFLVVTFTAFASL
ncbi:MULTISPECIES: hypothetical protein [Sinorhizobium]|uniref:Uncharacterized protein n=1 Tax=Sinorhizobium psoraleae TaxID=520838 RepID=A0ABT4KH35_9HYPH|nr:MULTISPECIES: hypothetical protein [Sinorhizobium]MCZ4090267.1 hypothetical protein [Sinorhizobium psoraleae]MDK1384409.1 hypothetical protein [Sinorhizobium sp. 7-81]